MKSIWHIGLVLVSSQLAIAAGSPQPEGELIQDTHFQRGFLLWEPKPGRHVRYGELRGHEAGAASWGLAQWSSRFPIQASTGVTGEPGVLTWSDAAKAIRKRLNCDAVLITRGDKGMMLLGGGYETVYVGTAAREVYDVTGAGDTVIAALAVGLAAGATMIEAAIFANQAAGIVVGKVGTATASADELITAIHQGPKQ